MFLKGVLIESRGDDLRAITAYLRTGFRSAGVLRRRILEADELHDLYAMSILREEFESAALEFQ